MPEAEVFPLTSSYPITRRVLGGTIEIEAESGRRVSRLARAPRFVHELELHLSTTEKQQLEEWHRRFETSFFSLRDPVYAAAEGAGYVERYFSVEFASTPEYELLSNNLWRARLTLVDRVGAALFSYPDPDAGHKSVFLEEDAGFVVAGTWTSAAQALAHGSPEASGEKSNTNLNTTDAFQWVYGGYGFRLWARRSSDLGILEVFLDDASLGTVDLYATGGIASTPVFTKLDVPLGLHRVKLKATNTKNPSSSANTILADTLEMLI
jgi:hypothetical protein